MRLTINTTKKRQVIDITGEIQEQINSGDAAVLITVLHTTCAITTADLDPGTDLDFLDFLEAITPNIKWRHPHNPKHAPDHLLSALIGSSLTLSIEDGQLQLGQWQRVVLVEFDGPRQRDIMIKLINSINSINSNED